MRRQTNETKYVNDEELPIRAMAKLQKKEKERDRSDRNDSRGTGKEAQGGLARFDEYV